MTLNYNIVYNVTGKSKYVDFGLMINRSNQKL